MNDFFPVPLIYENRMNVVRTFIAADGIHIRVDAFSDLKSVFFQGVTFPFCERMDNFGIFIVLLLNTESNRAFITV